MHKFSISNFQNQTPFEKHQQWEKLTKVERVGGSGSGNEDQAWGKKHRPDHRPLFEDPSALVCSLLFSLETVQRRSLPLPRVDCVGLFVWTVSVSLRCWGWGAPWPPHSAVQLLRFCQNIANICRSSLMIFLKIAKLFEISSANVKGWSQVENRNRLTDQALSYVGKGFWLLKICFWTFKKELRSIFSGFQGSTQV